jgi:ADP-ribose pyrophosphatase YjhB (NUDIX family)
MSHGAVDPLRSLFRHCPRCGRPGFAAAPGAALSCAGCGLVYYLNPAVAAAALIRDASDRILFIRRARDPGRGKLAFPGGFVDKMETAEDAVCREIREELGLELTQLAYLTSATNVYVYREVTYSVLDLHFLARVRSFDVVAQAQEVGGYALFERRAVPRDELAFESHRVALRALDAREPVGS